MKVVITGGAGFLGANLADRLAGAGQPVVVLDSLARPGVQRNLDWLCQRHRGLVTAVIADIRDADAVAEAVRDARAVLHLAAQVAVTTSLDDPLADFEINARGTLQLLEALRRQAEPPPLLFASTNKVYGKLFPAEALACDATRRGATAATRPRRSTSTAPTAAPRVPPTSTCSTTPACSACRPSSSA
jgi:CDP-paratose 2-epimerase